MIFRLGRPPSSTLFLTHAIATVCLVGVLTGPLHARTTESVSDKLVCDTAARGASRASGVPLDVMMAITRTETGRKRHGKIEPWPWTVNMEGKGIWFETEDAARAYVYKHFKRGARSFDVGCFQINFRWHGQAFKSIDDMFDPSLNAEYAAQFLLDLFGETGDWSRAAGAFHSRTRSLAEKYRKRFDRHRQAIASRPAPQNAPRSEPKTRAKVSPLIAGSPTTGLLGSLVPRSSRPADGRFIPLGGVSALKPRG